MSDQPVSDEAEYGLVMPFVVCRSVGGPYDDRSFVAGFRLGAIDHSLRMAPTEASTFRFLVEPEDVPQLDLIAMKHHCKLRLIDVAEGWLAAFLRRLP